jgi:hypothetical protein
MQVLSLHPQASRKTSVFFRPRGSTGSDHLHRRRLGRCVLGSLLQPGRARRQADARRDERWHSYRPCSHALSPASGLTHETHIWPESSGGRVPMATRSKT